MKFKQLFNISTVQSQKCKIYYHKSNSLKVYLETFIERSLIFISILGLIFPGNKDDHNTEVLQYGNNRPTLKLTHSNPLNQQKFFYAGTDIQTKIWHNIWFAYITSWNMRISKNGVILPSNFVANGLIHWY